MGDNNYYKGGVSDKSSLIPRSELKVFFFWIYN